MQDFRNLLVWKRAHELALLTYRITADFPKDEVFGLRHSMRKAATGCGKPNDAEFSRSIAAAVAVAYRLEYQALMAKDLEFIDEKLFNELESEITEVKKMLNGFNRKLT